MKRPFAPKTKNMSDANLKDCALLFKELEPFFKEEEKKMSLRSKDVRKLKQLLKSLDKYKTKKDEKNIQLYNDKLKSKYNEWGGLVDRISKDFDNRLDEIFETHKQAFSFLDTLLDETDE